MKNAFDWKIARFQELSPDELYDILYLREKVFVVEQNCAYQEADGYDRNALHLMGRREGKIVAYARLLAPGVDYHGTVLKEDAIIGRVLADGSVRGAGLGHQLMRWAVESVASSYGKVAITLSAQARLVGFYGRHGFVATSDEYLEDNQPHIRMRRAAEAFTKA